MKLTQKPRYLSLFGLNQDFSFMHEKNTRKGVIVPFKLLCNGYIYSFHGYRITLVSVFGISFVRNQHQFSH